MWFLAVADCHLPFRPNKKIRKNECFDYVGMRELGVS